MRDWTVVSNKFGKARPGTFPAIAPALQFLFIQNGFVTGPALTRAASTGRCSSFYATAVPAAMSLCKVHGGMNVSSNLFA
jgi:hypothetical protein